MDRLRIRTHKELSGVTEKYMGFSFKQWFFILLALGITIPFYIYVKDVIGEELTSWIVIFIGVPIMLCGFLEVQGLSFAKLLPYLNRHYIDFAKPIQYKTQEQLEQEKRERSFQGRRAKRKEQKRQIKEARKQEKAQGKILSKQSGFNPYFESSSYAAFYAQPVKMSRKEKRAERKRQKERQKIQKIQREQARQLAQAQKKYADIDFENYFDERIAASQRRAGSSEHRLEG
jgi:hypothetical protein